MIQFGILSLRAKSRPMKIIIKDKYHHNFLGEPVRGIFCKTRKFPELSRKYPSVVFMGLFVMTPGTNNMSEMCL